MDSLVTLGGALSGSALAGAVSPSSGGTGIDVQAGINKMNKLLQQGLNEALNYTQTNTNKATGFEQTALQNATSALNNAMTSGSSQIQGLLNQGTAQYTAAQSPFAQAGYAANDALMDSLGLSRPTVGSAAMAQAQSQLASIQPLLQQLQSSASTAGISNPYAVNSAPTAPIAPQLSSFAGQITPQQIQQYIEGNSRNGKVFQNGTNNVMGYYTPTGTMAYNAQQNQPGFAAAVSRDNTGTQQAVQNYLAQQAYQNAMGTYNNTTMPAYQTQLGNFNNYNQAYQNLQGQLNNMNPQAIQLALAQNRGLLNGG